MKSNRQQELSAQLEENGRDMELLRSELSSARSHLADAERQVSSLNRQLGEFESTLASLQEAHLGAETNVVNSRQRADAAQGELEGALATRAAVMPAVSFFEREEAMGRTPTPLADLRKEIETVSSAIPELQENAENFENEAQRAEQGAKEIRSQIMKLDKDLDVTKGLLKDVSLDVDQTRPEIAKLESKELKLRSDAGRLNDDIKQLGQEISALSTQAATQSDQLMQRAQATTDRISVRETSPPTTTAGTAAPQRSALLQYELDHLNQPPGPEPTWKQALWNAAPQYSKLALRHGLIIAPSIFFAHVLSKLTSTNSDMSAEEAERMVTSQYALNMGLLAADALYARLNPYTSEQPNMMSDLGHLGMAAFLSAPYAAVQKLGLAPAAAPFVKRLSYFFTPFRDGWGLPWFPFLTNRHPGNPDWIEPRLITSLIYAAELFGAALPLNTRGDFSGPSELGQLLPWSKAILGFIGSGVINAVPEILNLIGVNAAEGAYDRLRPYPEVNDPARPQGELSPEETLVLNQAITEMLANSPKRGLKSGLADLKVNVGFQWPTWQRFRNQFQLALANTMFFESGIHLSTAVGSALPTVNPPGIGQGAGASLGALVRYNAKLYSAVSAWYGLGDVAFTALLNGNPTERWKYSSDTWLGRILGATVPKRTSASPPHQDLAAQRQ